MIGFLLRQRAVEPIAKGQRQTHIEKLHPKGHKGGNSGVTIVCSKLLEEGIGGKYCKEASLYTSPSLFHRPTGDKRCFEV